MKFKSDELQQIIKEEIARLKRKESLEIERENLIREMEECDMMDEWNTMEEVAPNIAIPAVQGLDKKVKDNVEVILSRLNSEQLEKLRAELSSLGIEGATEEEIKSKVMDMLPMNESMLDESWDKSKIYNWLIGAGLGATASGIAAAAIGATSSKEISANLTTPVLAGIIAIVLGAITAGIGTQIRHSDMVSKKPQMNQAKAANVIAKRKAMGRK